MCHPLKSRRWRYGNLAAIDALGQQAELFLAHDRPRLMAYRLFGSRTPPMRNDFPPVVIVM